ncbi:MAG: hypothetical protein JWP01_1415 [Myxococcales bacterium]|nr:hypothetical protein [Myxococcales bacterium]
MSWLHLVALGTAGIASMTTAMKEGNLEEAARQGLLAGPAVVEQALTAPDPATRMSGIVAAPHMDDRIELLEALAVTAGGPDRRTAIPAARAARVIARDFAHRSAEGIPDDIAVSDLLAWRDAWGVLALDRDRWIELRVMAVDVAATLDELALPAALRDDATTGGSSAPAAATGSGATATGTPSISSQAARATHGAGIDLAKALADPDPAFRRAAVGAMPVPLPVALRGPLAAAIVTDTDPLVALGAAQALCADLVADQAKPILETLGAPGLTRLRTIISTEGSSRGTLRDAARCLEADKAPASAAALRTIRARLR